MNKIILTSSLSIMLLGCSVPVPIPTVNLPEQQINAIHTVQLDKIRLLSAELVRINAPTIYIYVEKDAAVNESGTGAGELPRSMRRQLKSLLLDFKPKVKVVDSIDGIVNILTVHKKDKTIESKIFTLNGGITQYDKDIMNQSTDFDLSIDFGGGDGEGTGNGNLKDKDSQTVLGMDFYLKSLKSNDILVHKTSSKIDLRKTTRGYSFGLFINKGGIGASAYKTIKDGVGLSVRKLLQESMYNLIRKAYGI